jgi:hypothetical protein
MNSRRFVISTLAAAAVLLSSPNSFASGGTGGGGGTTTTTTIPSVLPTTAPAPGVLMRESFGMGNTLRPSGGKGTLKDYLTHTSISGFWIEYPGSKDTAWLAAPEPQTWRVCAESANPYEMYSPLQVTYGNACAWSDWTAPITSTPAALMPFKAPAGAYEISINAWPAPSLTNTYLGFGFTDSSVLDANLQTSGTVWVLLKVLDPNNFLTTYELRTNGMSGPMLASGTTYFDAFTRIVLSYDPAARTVSASVNEIPLGVFPATLSPKFIAFEGFGGMDNFVVRQLP